MLELIRPPSRRFSGWILLASLIFLGGCAGTDLRGPGFVDNWGTNLRQGVQGDTAVGASTKAREIENNLGFY